MFFRFPVFLHTTYMNQGKLILFLPADVNTHQSKGIPWFLKVHFMGFHFYERPALVAIWVNPKESKEFFALQKKKKKKVKSENKVHNLFHHKPFIEVAHSLSIKSDITKGFPQNYTLYLIKSHSFECHSLCEHLCFTSMYFVHPLVRHVLGWLLLYFTVFGLMKLS